VIDAPVRRGLGRHWLTSVGYLRCGAVLFSSRGVRTFADGCVSVLLPVYLLGLGLTSPAY